MADDELEMHQNAPYSIGMSHAERHDVPPADWIEALDRSKAEVESGQAVPLEPVLQGLRDSLARMDTQKPASAAKR